MNPRVNELLDSLPDNEYQILTSKMDLVSLTKGQTLFEVGMIPQYVYFPVGALISMVNDGPDGNSVETYMIGKACFAGVGALGIPSFYRATVRSGGLAYRLSVSDLMSAAKCCPVYEDRVKFSVQRMLMRMSTSVLCGKKHTIEQQLVRWILVSLDRTLTNQMDITHREISDLLGFRREGVTLALGKFIDAGLIETSRGNLTVVDRAGLEAISCDCYWIGQEKKRPELYLV